MQHGGARRLLRRCSRPAVRRRRIDVGAGGDSLRRLPRALPRMRRCRAWDLPDGDAWLLEGVADEASTRAVEPTPRAHARAGGRARPLDRCRAGGHLLVIVADELTLRAGSPCDVQHLPQVLRDRRGELVASPVDATADDGVSDRVLLSRSNCLDAWPPPATRMRSVGGVGQTATSTARSRRAVDIAGSTPGIYRDRR